jgi:hypothetical protein
MYPGSVHRVLVGFLPLTPIPEMVRQDGCELINVAAMCVFQDLADTDMKSLTVLLEQ